MGMINVKSYRKTLRKSFYQNLIIGLGVGYRKFNIRVSKNAVVLLQILALSCKVHLIDQYLLQRVVVDRNLEAFRYFWKYFAKKEQYVDVSLNIFLHIRMSNLQRNFLPLKFSFVNLTYWTRSNWFWVKLIKHLVDVHSIYPFEYSFCLLLGMSGRIIS